MAITMRHRLLDLTYVQSEVLVVATSLQSHMRHHGDACGFGDSSPLLELHFAHTLDPVVGGAS